jgi:hypothetical protein
LKKVTIGALLVLMVAGSLAFGAAPVGAESEPEPCLQTDHPEIERLKDEYHWLEEAADRANVVLVESFGERSVAGTATHLLARVRILKSYCNDTFLRIYLHEMAHIFHRNNSVYVDPILRDGFRERYCRMLEAEFFADTVAYIFDPRPQSPPYYWRSVVYTPEWLYDFAEAQNRHESNAEACTALSIAVIPSCDDVRDVERILREEQEDIELPTVHCASVYDPDSPDSEGEAPDGPDAGSEADG